MTDIGQRLSQDPAERRRQFLQRLRGDTPATAPAGEPLSGQQEHAWVLTRAAGERPAGLIAADLLLTGPVDRAALRTALDRLLAAVPMLRMTFTEDGDTVRQRPGQRPGDVVVEHPDAPAPESLLAAGHGPRIHLWDDAAGAHLTLVASALLLDRDSLRPFADGLAAHYRAPDGDAVDWAGPGDYLAHARAERAWLAGPGGREALAHWGRLDRAEPTELPADHPYPARLPVAAEQHRTRVTARLLAGLDGLAERLGVAADSVLLASYALLLHRHSGQPEVTVGVPERTGSGLIGNATNLLPLRLGFPPERAVADLVRDVDAGMRSARAHGRVPFPRIVEAVNPQRDQNRAPLAQTSFQVVAADRPRPFADGITACWHPLAVRPYGHELSLTVQRDDDGAELILDYVTELFERATAEALVERYTVLLEAVVAGPESAVADLAVLPARERRLLLEEWNRSDRPETPATIPRMFEERVAADPTATAVTFGEEEVTYGELHARANRLAHHLLASRLRVEDRVAIFLPRSVDAVVATLAVLSAGAAYLPIDVEFPDNRVATIVQDAGPTAIITTYELARRLPRGPWLETLLDEEAADIERAPAEPPRTGLSPENLAYVIYTSGSSGKPKGVLIEHRAVTNFVHNVQEMFDLSPADNVLQFAAPTFDVSVFETFGALLSGAVLHLCDKEDRYSTDRLTRLMRRRRVSVIDLPPAVLELLDATAFPDLRIVFVGGEAFSGELTTAWAAGGRRFFNGYGPTETTVTVIAKECQGVWTQSPPIGRAMGNHHAYVLDEQRRPVPVGVRGELYVSGLGAARGYLGRPDLTEAAFCDDPYRPGWRMYRTGDLARWNWDGDLVYAGRADRQVKIRGIRIELGEIERVLLEHPQVRQCLVRVTTGGAGEKRLLAYYVPRAGARPRSAALRAFVGGELPGYMVPADFVEISEVPLTTSGKVDLAALPDAGREEPDGGGAGPQEAPATETERTVAQEIFVPLLSTERVGMEQNFFQLGGSSLQATQVLSRVRRIFGVEVSVGEFFQQPTVRGLASAVDELRRSPAGDAGDDLENALAQIEADRKERPR